MKFDAAHVWKDEVYRLNLSNEHVSLLPEHPSGELDDVDLAFVYGGDKGEWRITGPVASNSLTSRKRDRWHSLTIAACETNAFSTTRIIPSDPLLLNLITVICTNYS